MRSEGFQYLVLAWPTQSEPAAQQAAVLRQRLAATQTWRCAAAEPGLDVWTRGAGRATLVRLRPGVLVLGDLFAAPGSSGVSRAASPATAAAAARDLAASGWGRYVALLAGAEDDLPSIFRDPSGAVDAITWTAGRVAAASNDIRGLPAGFAPDALALDWDVITDFIRRPLSATYRLGLTGYHTVTPGDLQPLGAPGSCATPIWRPQDHAANVEAPDAAHQLPQVLRHCVQAMADAEPALVEVSGGLDSAVVAAALGEAGRGTLLGLNYYGDRAEGDERRWARMVCERAGFPLLEHPKPVTPVVEADFAAFAACARPALNALDPDRDRHTAALAEATGASAIFTGNGGDALFFQHPTPLVAADYRRWRGRTGPKDPVLQEMARWLRRSVWSVQRHSRQGFAEPAASPLWGARARDAVAAPAHGWLAGGHDLPPAKSLQVQLIAASQAAFGVCRRGAAADLRHPLLSQPVMELCLAIPTWQHVAGGQDRALVRRAFSGALPDEVLQRRSKGALTSLYTRRAAASLEFLRAHLLDGVLVEAEVLDRRALDEALQADRLIWRADGARVMGAAMVESWVRRWQGVAPDLARAARHPPRSVLV